MSRLAAALLPLLILAHAAAAQQKELLFLAEDVPAGLDYDGPSAAVGTSQTGYLNLTEPMIYYP